MCLLANGAPRKGRARNQPYVSGSLSQCHGFNATQTPRRRAWKNVVTSKAKLVVFPLGGRDHF